MKTLESRLSALRKNGGQVRVMILGLGSVGNYLLNYLLSMQDERLAIYVVGRDEEKLSCDVNIADRKSVV